MKLEEHEKAYREHLKNIERFIEEGIIENQRNIGFNVSQGSVELFAMYLHKLNLLQGSGDQFDHRVFKSENLIKNKVPIIFSSRKEILKLMKELENERVALCYGNRKSKERIEKSIEYFNELRKIINKNLGKKENDRKK